jgi:AraC-like DNA-binding protein
MLSLRAIASVRTHALNLCSLDNKTVKILSLVDHYMVTSAFGHTLSNYCQDFGLDFAEIAQKFEMDEKKFGESGACVGLIPFGEMLEYLAEQCSDDVFGLSYGQTLKLGNSGSFGFGMMNAPDLNQALRFMARYLPLVIDSIDLKVINGSHHCRMEWTYSPLFLAKDQYVDLVTLLVHSHIRQFTGPNWLPRAVSLQRTPPLSLRQHQKHFSPNLKFGADSNSIEFSSSQLLCKNPNADHRLFEIMDKQCAMMLEQRKRIVPLELQIREEVLHALGKGKTSLVDIARKLCLTERSLQRHLAKVGTSFEIIVDETRQELSEQLLLHCNLTHAQISDRLGYSTPSAYSRAAKRWRISIPRGIEHHKDANVLAHFV